VRKLLLLVAANVGLVLVLLAFVEFGLRFTPFNVVRNPAASTPLGYYVADPELGVRIKANYPKSWFTFRGPGHEVFSNSLGCFDRPVELTADEPYILAIGDSFTWGYNPLEAKWTSLIEQELGVRVLKCGVAGTGTLYQFKQLKRLLSRLPHPPALVIHLYDTTDFNDDFIFPAETVSDGRRVDDFERIRLSDGARVAAGRETARNRRGNMYSSRGRPHKNPLVLSALTDVALTMDTMVEKRRLVIEGLKPQYLHWRYELNLLLLDPGDYPLVSRKLDEHMNAIREIRDTVRQAGANYALFHTNSFRLPAEKPMVQRLDAFFQSMPEFLGWLPELGRHMFDPHWNADSEKAAAAFMLERLEPVRSSAKSQHLL
jgi:hypothetical protein